MAIKLVVPSESIMVIWFCTRLAQRHCAAGDFNDPAIGSWARWRRRDQRNILLRGRQMMEEIGEGLGMHQPVLECNCEHLFRDLVRQIIDCLPNA